jgi:hypothetical protein
MAYYAAAQAREAGGAAAAALPYPLSVVAGNLYRHFPELPDTRVIYMRENNSELTSGDDLLSGTSLPILAETVWYLAGYAGRIGRDDAPIVSMARSIVPGQPWCCAPMLVYGPKSAAAAATGF